MDIYVCSVCDNSSKKLQREMKECCYIDDNLKLININKRKYNELKSITRPRTYSIHNFDEFFSRNK